MSTPTGFMEYKRQLPTDREPAERIKDWEEFHKHMAEEEPQNTRCTMHGLWYPVLPYRYRYDWWHVRLPRA